MHLTPTEYDLLALLPGPPGPVFSRDELLADVWGYDDGCGGRAPSTRTSAVVRRKLGTTSSGPSTGSATR